MQETTQTQTTTAPGYEASKITDGKWGVFYRLDERTSFGPKAVHRTRKAAKRDASERNWAEREMAKERS